MGEKEWMQSLLLLMASENDFTTKCRELLRLGCSFFQAEIGLYIHIDAGGTMTVQTAEPKWARPLEGNHFPFVQLLEEARHRPVFSRLGMDASLADGSKVGACLGLPVYRDGVLQCIVCWISRNPKPNGFPDVSDLVCQSLAEWIARESQACQQLSPERYQHVSAILQGSQHFLLLTEPDGSILEVSRLAETGTGLSPEEIRCIKVWELPTLVENESAAMRAKEAIERSQAGETVHFQEELVNIKGHPVKIDASYTPICDANGEVIFLLVEGRDITERIDLERQFQESQKLESLGVLAGGIAHDFNNLLTTILGNANLCSMELPPQSICRPYVASIENAAQKSAELCRQMLAYSGRGHFLVKDRRLGELITNVQDLLAAAVSHHVELRFDLAEDLPEVRVDQRQIQQILMNLVINASESIGKAGGTVTVRTGLQELRKEDLQECTFNGGLKAGPHVFLEVADTGSGMEPEILKRIFEPFFTTKFTGRGLGLAAVLGIVRGHWGGIHISSQVERGTTFRLFLPVSPAGTKQGQSEGTGTSRGKRQPGAESSIQPALPSNLRKTKM